MSSYCVVFITVPDANLGDRIAKHLVEEKLAACVNQLPGIKSRYRWEGKVETAEEILLIVKTRSGLLPEVTQYVKSVHPYSVPEVIALPITEGYAPYLNWIGANTLFSSSQEPQNRPR